MLKDVPISSPALPFSSPKSRPVHPAQPPQACAKKKDGLPRQCVRRLAMTSSGVSRLGMTESAKRPHLSWRTSPQVGVAIRFPCHPERSEGSPGIQRTGRFFAPLRMTQKTGKSGSDNRPAALPSGSMKKQDPKDELSGPVYTVCDLTQALRTESM